MMECEKGFRGGKIVVDRCAEVLLQYLIHEALNLVSYIGKGYRVANC